MSAEDGFKPRLGRLGDQGRSGGKRFRQRLLKAGAKLNRTARKPAFTGARIGRGTAAGPALITEPAVWRPGMARA